MNYLAHLLLSGPDPDWQLGGLLGDFVKGPLTGARPQSIEDGMRLHRRIDLLSDQHPAFLSALTRLGPGWRRLGGIALDIWFDHLLANSWEQWHPHPLETFSQQCWSNFRERQQWIPENAQTFIQRAEQFKLLPGYREVDVIQRTLERVGQRLRRPQPLVDMLPLLERDRRALEQEFQQLFADLSQQAERFRQQVNE
ncbi:MULTISPECIES: acyl carrier protein phosphodiesterase [Microbulbifer]|uniref:acyl carrier protein phosphodiesterase n=1 Tax=Microbulbifer TaxID=48073 RepID=UPI001CD435FD|nr:ACP phosphodiesterase [Microbulbifer agarilyticus]MCA0900004.1 ACP phosphodiesterase [Microbulbifer agarilyticus]